MPKGVWSGFARCRFTRDHPPGLLKLRIGRLFSQRQVSTHPNGRQLILNGILSPTPTAGRAWQGTLSNYPATPIRIEAAALQGKPVAFEIIYPWTRTPQMEPVRQSTREDTQGGIALVVFIVAPTAGGIFFARRNLRLGRGDRRNATRLAFIVIALIIFYWTFAVHHVLTAWEVILFLIVAGISLLVGGWPWVLYTAIEPFVRRRWPQILVSWTRLLSGDLGDPLVARDMLAGCTGGVFMASILVYLRAFLPTWLGFTKPLPQGLDLVTTGRSLISGFLLMFIAFVFISLGLLCLLFLLRLLLRKDRATFVVWMLLLPLANMVTGSWINGIIMLAQFALWFFLLMRFGLVSLVLAGFVSAMIGSNPITLDASAWYAGYGYAALAVIAAIVFYALRTSLGGRPLLTPSRLDD